MGAIVTRGTPNGNRIPRWYLDRFTIRNAPTPPKPTDSERVNAFLEGL